MKMLFILLLLALPSRSFGSGILLSSTDDFTDFASKVNSGSTYSEDTVYLGSDITLHESIDPIGTDDTHQFLGVFDGQGHAISNLTMNSSLRLVGLFGYSYGLTIRKVVLDSSCSITNSFSGSDYIFVGGIIGACTASNGECITENNVNMADVMFSGSTSYSVYMGGISGILYSSSYNAYMKNCVNYGSVTDSGTVGKWAGLGGIVGCSERTSTSTYDTYIYIQNCLNYGPITYGGTSVKFALGGIVAYGAYYTYIENCVSAGKIITQTTASGISYIGSIMGVVYSPGIYINYCYFTSDVNASSINGYDAFIPTTTRTTNFTVGVDSELVSKLNSNATSCNWAKWFMLHLNGGSINNLAQELLVEIQEHIPDPVKEGNRFLFWCKDAGCTEKFDPATDPIDEATDLYAAWANNTVTFDVSGGNPLPDSEVTKTVIFAEEYGDLPEPNRAGYAFLGWLDENNENVTNRTIVNTPKNHILYARWAANNYIVTFNVSGGASLSDSEATKTVTFDEIYAKLPEPNRAGFTFAGWFTGGGAKIEPYTTMTTAENHVLYAHWTANEYVVVFDVSGGNYIDELAKEVRFAEKYGDLPEPNRTGYSFAGWLDENDKNVTNETIVKIPKNHVLHALWIANSYFVTFDVSGGNSLPDDEATKTVTFDKIYGDLPEPNRTGYAFLGWLDENNKNVTNETIVITPKNHVLYAYWAPNNYFVIFNVSGGNPLPDSEATKTVIFDEKYGDLPELSKAGFTFAGWFTGGGAKIEPYTTMTTAENHVLYANWTANEYFVIFDVSGGNSLSVDGLAKEVIFAEEYGDLPEPNRTGYSFAGWFDESDENVTNETIVITPKNHALYAHWIANNYFVTFDVSGGNFLPDDELTKIVIFVEEYGDLPEPNRTGYAFLGWLDENDKNVTNETTVNIPKNHALYAHWEPNKYTVTFNVSGGDLLSDDEATKTVIFDEVYAELPEPNRAGYAFAGWFAGDGTKIESYTAMTTAENHFLYANWTANEYVVVFDVSGGNSLSIDELAKEVTFTEKYGDLPEPNRTGYAFLGWLDENDKNVTNGTTVITPKNHVLYAHWIANNYFVTFNVSGGALLPDSEATKTVIFDKVYGDLPEPNRAGYAFLGWFDDGNESVSNETTVITPKNHALYAHWDPIQYTISFDSNGGSACGNITQDFGTLLVLSEPEMAGYTFLGWFDADLATKYMADTVQAGNVTLYAKWEANNYTVTFDVGGGASLPYDEITKTVRFDKEYGDLPEPNRTGYSFIGWFDEDNNLTTNETTVITPKNHVLHAYWIANNYFVTFDVSGGASLPNSEVTKTVTFDEIYAKLPESNRAGFTFAGWFAGDGTKIEPYTAMTTAENHVLYANWTANEYVVVFDVNRGNYIDELAKEVRFAEEYGDLPEPNRTGYAFLGWFDEDDKPITNETTVITPKYHTLYAHWIANNYFVTFDVSGGNSLPDDELTKTVTFDKIYGDLPEPNRTGYAFLGWFNDDNESVSNETVVITPKNHIPYAHVTPNVNGRSAPETPSTVKINSTDGGSSTPSRTGHTLAGWADPLFNGNKVNSTTTVRTPSNHTLYAHWAPNNYTVTFDVSGGASLFDSEATKIVTFDEKYGELPEPNRTGYSFTGWFDEDNNLITNETTVNIPKNHTLYAHWIANSYTLTFDFSNGTVTVKILDFNAPIEYPDSPVWEGHTFYGWDKNITSMPAENLTITALWASSTVTIVFSKKELGSGEIRDKIIEIASRESMTVTIIIEYEDDDTVQYIVLFVDRSEAEVKEFAKEILNNEVLKPAINHAEVNGQEWSSSGGDSSNNNNTTVIVVVVVVIVVVVAVLLGLLGFFLVMRRQSVAAAKALNGAWNRIAGVAVEVVDASAFKSRFKKGNKIYPKDYVRPQSIAAALINAGLDKDTASKAAEMCRKTAVASSEKGRIKGDLSVRDVEAVCLYTLELEEHEKSPYMVLNRALRAKKNKTEIVNVRDLLYLVMKGLRKLPVVHKDRLYRGVREKLDAKEYKEGSVVVWPAFSSTSPDMDVTKEFLKKVDEKGSINDGGDVELSNISRGSDNREEDEGEGVSSGTLFIIEDGWGYDIQPYSRFSKEKEILLEPEQEFEVVSVMDSGDFLLVTLRMRKTKAILPDLFGKRHDGSSKVIKE